MVCCSGDKGVGGATFAFFEEIFFPPASSKARAGSSASIDDDEEEEDEEDEPIETGAVGGEAGAATGGAEDAEFRFESA